jgi:putative ABC transport system permease protein
MPAGFNYPRGADMPALLQFAEQTDIWRPMAFSAERVNNRGSFNNSLIARLKPGTTTGQAQTELSTIAARNEQRFPQTDADFGALVLPLHDQIVGGLRPALTVLLGAVGFVLLIACANVANLLLARAAGRQKEIAIRTALGARRLRIIRQLLTESLVLSCTGGALGLALAYGGVKLLVAAAPDDIPRIRDVNLDLRVLLFTLAVAMLSGIVFGLAPALQSSRPDLNESLKAGGRGSTARRHGIRDALVVAEVALSLVLLIGAGLMIRSIIRLYQVDLGMEPANVLTLQVNIPFSRYTKLDQRIDFYRQVMERIRALPGVTSVGGTTHLPLTGGGDIEALYIEGQPPPDSLDKAPLANYDGVTTDYFRTAGIPVLAGRVFEERDDKQSPDVIVVNEAFARRYLAGADPVGKRILNDLPGEAGARWFTIIGVVGNVKYDALDAEIKPAVYYHYLQNTDNDLAIVMHASYTAAASARAAENEIWAVDPDIPVFNVATMDQIISASASQRRFNLLLMCLFAAIALALAAIGIYGVMSYTVTQRTHEIGIRMALGAKRGDVVRMVVLRGMGLAAAGTGLGVAVAMGVTRLLRSLLFSTSTVDALTFAVIPLLLMAVAFVSNLGPARKATRVDPLVALRYE